MNYRAGQEIIVHNFKSLGGHSIKPFKALITDPKFSLYGATYIRAIALENLEYIDNSYIPCYATKGHHLLVEYSQLQPTRYKLK